MRITRAGLTLQSTRNTFFHKDPVDFTQRIPQKVLCVRKEAYLNRPNLNQTL